jgi:MFS family permease
MYSNLNRHSSLGRIFVKRNGSASKGWLREHLRIRRILPQTPREKAYASITLVDSAGTGLLLATIVVYLVRYAGLSPAQIGIGLTIAGITGLAASIPAGQLGDRFGQRNTLIVVNCARGALFIGYLFIHSFPAFLLIVCLLELTDASANTCREAYLYTLFGPQRRVGVSAYNRAMQNVGISVGSLGAGVALGFGTREAFSILIVGDAASYFIICFILAMLPPGTARRSSKNVYSSYFLKANSLATSLFILLSIVCGVILIEDDVLTIALPLWIVRRTSAPHPIIASILIINTALVAAFQVRASRSVDVPARAAVAGRRGGLAVLLGCVLCAVTGYIPVVATVMLLVVAIIVMTIGEMLGSAAAWGLVYGLSPSDNQGTYFGMWELGTRTASVGGPAISTSLTLGIGTVGWFALGLLFFGAGMLQRPISQLALRNGLRASPEV